MNILIIPDVGRSFNSVRPEAEIYIGLANAGHKVTIMTDLNGAYAERYAQHNIDLVELKMDKKLSLSAINKIRKLIKSKKIDIVYASKSRTIPNAAFGCIGTTAKMVAYRGTTGGLYKSDLTNYLSILHPRVNGIIGVSNAVTAHVKSSVRKKIHPFVKTIYKGHDLSWYSQPPSDLSALATKSDQITQPDAFNVLCIGSKRPHKGMQYMIEAAAKLTHLPKLNILLVGDHFDCEPFLTQIQQTGMAERIIMPGFRNDVPQLAGACDLLVLPSLREGLPRAVLESLAYATPVIASANPGTMEVIKDGVNGLIVPLKNSQAIADKITQLYQDKALYSQLKSQTQATIKNQFSHQKTVLEYEKYFTELLQQK
ncbi:glycosyltransferase family 4 protein [Aliikangiella sp. IMCC44632]